MPCKPRRSGRCAAHVCAYHGVLLKLTRHWNSSPPSSSLPSRHADSRYDPPEFYRGLGARQRRPKHPPNVRTGVLCTQLFPAATGGDATLNERALWWLGIPEMLHEGRFRWLDAWILQDPQWRSGKLTASAAAHPRRLRRLRHRCPLCQRPPSTSSKTRTDRNVKTSRGRHDRRHTGLKGKGTETEHKGVR